VTGAAPGEPPQARAVPFVCPYCADEDLRPDEERAVFHCRACDRRFALRFLGMGPGS
jgi:hypothetical protein